MNVANVCYFFVNLQNALYTVRIAREAYEDYNDNEEKSRWKRVTKIATKSLLCASQTVDFFAPSLGVGRATRRWIKSGVGVSDVGQMVVKRCFSPRGIQKSDLLDVAAQATIRSAAVYGVGVTADQPLDEVEEQISQYLQSAGFLLKDWRNIAATPELCLTIGRSILKCLQHSPQDDEARRVGQLAIRARQEVLDANGFEDFQRIPILFRRDPILCRFRCAISGSPIRKAVCVEDPMHLDAPVLYEWDRIQNYFERGEKPESWPDGVPFTQRRLRGDRRYQEMIDNRLQELLDHLRQEEKRPITCCALL